MKCWWHSTCPQSQQDSDKVACCIGDWSHQGVLWMKGQWYSKSYCHDANWCPKGTLQNTRRKYMAMGGHLELPGNSCRVSKCVLVCFFFCSTPLWSRWTHCQLSELFKVWEGFCLSSQYRERIIFVGKPVDDEMGNQLVATMLYLDSENHQDMTFYINCAGGEVFVHSCISQVVFSSCQSW